MSDQIIRDEPFFGSRKLCNNDQIIARSHGNRYFSDDFPIVCTGRKLMTCKGLWRIFTIVFLCRILRLDAFGVSLLNQYLYFTIRLGILLCLIALKSILINNCANIKLQLPLFYSPGSLLSENVYFLKVYSNLQQKKNKKAPVQFFLIKPLPRPAANVK